MIPPQGAPVQCTRCQHVFTAKLPAAEPAPAPALPARPGNSTMMFGAPSVGTSPAPIANPKATMVFGAATATASAPAAKNQTMMFGTPASNAAAAPPAVSPPAARTQPMPAASAPAAKNQTMMFGTPASNAVAAPPAIAPAVSPPVAKNQTMMFGAPVAAPPPAVAPAVSPPVAKNQTMMFGTPAVGPAPAPAAPAASSKQTMVFGAVAPAAPVASSKQTMVFGTAAANGAAAGPVPAAASSSKTQLFGTPVDESVGEETMLEQPGQSARTVLFGTAQPAEAPAPAAPSAKNQTMMFGRPPVPAIPKVTAGTVELAGIAADEDQPNESTVRVDLQAEMADEAPAAQPDPEPRHDRTQRFAMSEVGGGPTPPTGNSAVDARHNRTQLFAMSSVQETTESSGKPVSAFAAQPEPAGAVMAGDTTLPPTSPDRLGRGSGDLATTLPPDAPEPLFTPQARADPAGVSVLQSPDDDAGDFGAPGSPGPVSTTLPNLPPLDAQRFAPLPLELPPEPQGSPRELLAAQQRLQAAQDSGAATVQLPRGGGGAGRVIVVILALIALALAGVLAWRLFGRQLMGNAASSEAIRSTEDALAGLRRDDAEAQEEAMARLRPLLAANPELHEAHAAMALTAALRLDDARAVAGPDEQLAKSLRLESDGEGEAAEAARARLETLEQKLTAQRATVEARQQELLAQVARLRALPPVEPRSTSEIAMLRAEAVARAVLGEGEALALAERVRQLSPTPDDWADLAGPEFALNGGSSQAEALAELEAVRQRPSNSTFFRPYVLAARLRMMAGNDAEAAQELTTVVSLNGKHVVAQRLLASLPSRN